VHQCAPVRPIEFVIKDLQAKKKSSCVVLPRRLSLYLLHQKCNWLKWNCNTEFRRFLRPY